MMLQFAVGPVCIFIFQIASLKGFLTAEAGVLGVTFMDGLFILTAILSISTIMENRKIRAGLTLFGAAVLLIFGLNLVLSLLDTNLLPNFHLEDYVFGFGALLAAVFFLTLVAFLGSLTHSFLKPFVVKMLNVTVGIVFIYFAAKMIINKTESQKESE